MDVMLDAIEVDPPGANNHNDRSNSHAGWPNEQINTDFHYYPQSSGPEAQTAYTSKSMNVVPAIHQCRICQRTYERADHLNRHLKSHENARRFQCQQCPKSFNRVDLLSRHVATHERNANSASGKATIRRTDRTGQACVACAAAKARCEEQKPCRRCRLKNVQCETTTRFSYQHNVRGSPRDSPRRASVSSNKFDIPTGGSDNTQRDEQTNNTQSTVVETLSSNLQTYGTSAEDFNILRSESTNQYPVENTLSLLPQLPPQESSNLHSLSLDATQLHFNDIMDEMLFFPNPAEFNNQDLDYGFLDFNFDGVELGMAAPTPKHVTINAPVKSGTLRKTKRSIRDVSKGYAAFTRSPWLYAPAQKDHILSDQDNLALDEENITSTLSPGSIHSQPHSQIGGIPFVDSSLRDRMFYLVSTMNKFNKRVPNFPSLDILNHILQAFFVKQSYQIDNWIHVPTISCDVAIPEFLLALVTAGTTVISVPAIWKMGLVLCDVVRVTTGDLWEHDNSHIRELQPLQAFMLSLDVGLWSGFQRQMEIAESFGLPLVTMIRRGGIFAAPADSQALIPVESDHGQILEMKWRKWAKRESFKRLAIHLFLHDARASISLQKSVMISFTEITFSLPASRALFLATSATDWKSKYLETHSTTKRQSLKLMDAMRNLSILEDMKDQIDADLCYSAILYGFWGQIWSFQESSKFHVGGERGDSVHQLWLTTQHREIYREIESFRETLLVVNEAKQQPDLILTAELFLMILHVSPEELQRFAGKAGEEAASAAFATLEKWSSTAHARRAIWHAGQVFRAAASMPPAELRDFCAIAVYLASLTLWAYGHLTSSSARDTPERSKGPKHVADSSGTSSVIALDGLETRESRVFVSSGLGIPALGCAGLGITPASIENSSDYVDSAESAVILTDPNAVLGVARDIYRNNFPAVGEPLPPLVENMANLMRDLSCLPESRFSRAPSPSEG